MLPNFYLFFFFFLQNISWGLFHETFLGEVCPVSWSDKAQKGKGSGGGSGKERLPGRRW